MYRPVTFFSMLISFLNDVDMQLILQFNNGCRKYHHVLPKNHEFFLGRSVYKLYQLQHDHQKTSKTTVFLASTNNNAIIIIDQKTNGTLIPNYF